MSQNYVYCECDPKQNINNNKIASNSKAYLHQ